MKEENVQMIAEILAEFRRRVDNMSSDYEPLFREGNRNAHEKIVELFADALSYEKKLPLFDKETFRITCGVGEL